MGASQKQKPEFECVICLEEARAVVFLPCKHIACCEKCAKAIKNCPVCRTAVESILQVFIS